MVWNAGSLDAERQTSIVRPDRKQDRRVAVLLMAAAINGVGSWAALVAMWGYSSYQLHSAAGNIALLAIAWTTPGVVFGPAAGFLVDRVGPRIVAVVSMLLGATASAGMAVSQTLLHLGIFAAVLGISRAFLSPAIDSIPPRLVGSDRLLSANAALSAASNAAIVVGPLLAGAILARWSPTWVFVLDVLTYVIGAALVGILPIGLAAEDRHHLDGYGGAFEGYAIFRRKPEIRSVFYLVGALYFSWATYLVLEPIYVRDILVQPNTIFAYLQMTFGVGFIGAALILARLSSFKVSAVMLPLFFIAAGIASAGYIATNITAVAFLFIFFWGVSDVVCTAPARTYLLQQVPMQVHGRILALDRSINSAANLIALPLAGFLVDLVGLQLVGVVTSVGVIVVAIAVLARFKFGQSQTSKCTLVSTEIAQKRPRQGWREQIRSNRAHP